MSEAVAQIARGQVIHPTGADMLFLRRDDVVQVPIEGLPPLLLGLVWRASHENARIRALAGVAATMAVQLFGHSTYDELRWEHRVNGTGRLR
jgi:hypothetical protein